jgi:hypothetical protein
MFTLQGRSKAPTLLDEISQYTLDLQVITELRDKAKLHGTTEEVADYDNTLKVMRKVLVILNQKLHSRRSD